MTPITITDYINKMRYLSKLFDNINLTDEQIQDINDIFNKKKSDLKTPINFINLSNNDIINKLKDKYKKNRTLIGYLNVIFVFKRQLNMEVNDLKDEIMDISNQIVIEREQNLINDNNLIDLDINHINNNIIKLSTELER